MKYILVKWNHSLLDEPVLFYSELDKERWERRKVEVFSDGRISYADCSKSVGHTRLALFPIPELDKISVDKQFETTEITKDEFEEVWRCEIKFHNKNGA
jgi:hypothetical protein